MENTVNLKETIKAFASEKGMTLKDVAERAGMSYNGLHNKFNRGSLTVRDLNILLDTVGKKITFVDKE